MHLFFPVGGSISQVNTARIMLICEPIQVSSISGIKKNAKKSSLTFIYLEIYQFGGVEVSIFQLSRLKIVPNTNKRSLEELKNQ